MRKILVSLLVMMSLLSVMVVGGDTDDTDLGGTLGDVVEISVEPSSIDFNTILQGSDVTVYGSDITISTVGSDTATNNVYVYLDVTGTDELFFETLFELKEQSALVYTDVTAISPIIIAEGASAIYNNQLHGDTAQFDAGIKSATLTYTAYGALQP